VLGVDTVVGGEQRYAGMTFAPGFSFEGHLQKAREMGREDLFVHLREETRKLPHVQEKFRQDGISYTIRIPEIKHKRVILSYDPFQSYGMMCTFNIGNLESMGVNGEQVWQNFCSQFDPHYGDSTWVQSFLNTRQEVDAWMQFVRNIWSEIFQ
jgi:hypothetical protein